MSDSGGESNEVGLTEAELKRQLQISSLNRDFSAYTHDANFCTYMKLVHDRSEAEESIKNNTFHPDFVHQFFVNNETIFGYTKPALKLFYSASRLKRYIRFDYEDKLTKERDGIDADNVMSMLQPILEDIKYTQDLSSFIQQVESDEEKSFRPPGDLLAEFEISYKKPSMLSRAQVEQLSVSTNNVGTSNGTEQTSNGYHTNGNAKDTHYEEKINGSQTKKVFQIYRADKNHKDFMEFQKYMQSFVLWFIDAANMIDVEDARWEIFMVFEKCNLAAKCEGDTAVIDSDNRYYFAGYATVYRYYVYPDKTRPRVSQMLLLPPYRRNTLGTHLLQTIYEWFKKQPETLDITAEDPAEEFIAMRDYLDCKNCLKLPLFQPEELKKGWSDEKAQEARNESRICSRQARKVYEILKLMHLDTSNEEEYKNYRLEIKNRLNGPNQRLKLDCEKLIKKGLEIPEEMRAKRDAFRFASLHETFQELEKQYRKTIDKLHRMPI